MYILSNIKFFTLFVFSLFYIGVGIAHFVQPIVFLRIMPPYLPFHLELVYISGFFEILFGLLLLFKRYRSYASYGLIFLLIAVFPANIYLYSSDLARELYGGVSQQQALIRMFFQLPLLIIAYWHGLSDASRIFTSFCVVLSLLTIIYFSSILF